MTGMTLRQLNDLDETPTSLSNSTLLMIDYQNTYTQGVLELDGWEQALEAASDLLNRARAVGTTVVHIIHDGGKDSPYDIKTDIGKIHEIVSPKEGEPIIVKTAPNAFAGTHLANLLEMAGHANVIIAGFMTHICVLSTTEGAFVHGKKATVVANACATRSVPVMGNDIPASQLHESALATIADLYGVVMTSADDIS